MSRLNGSAHRSWLAGECNRLLDFAQAAHHPRGGFAWLDDDGRPELARPRELWITCRMTHVFAVAHLLGRRGAGALADHGLAALDGLFADHEHGGWFAAEGGGTDKRAYDHAFVALAAASATVAGREGAAPLLDAALGVIEQRFWDERAGMCVDLWDPADHPGALSRG